MKALTEIERISAFPVHALWRIRVTTVADFLRDARNHGKQRPVTGERRALQGLVDSEVSAETGESVFLNCTKNTELTARRFTRTVSFTQANKSLVLWLEDSRRVFNQVRSTALRIIAP